MSSLRQLQEELDEERRNTKIWMGIGISFMILGTGLLILVIYLLNKPEEPCPSATWLTDADVTQAKASTEFLKAYKVKIDTFAKTAQVLGGPPTVQDVCAKPKCPTKVCPPASGKSKKKKPSVRFAPTADVRAKVAAPAVRRVVSTR